MSILSSYSEIVSRAFDNSCFSIWYQYKRRGFSNYLRPSCLTRSVVPFKAIWNYRKTWATYLSRGRKSSPIYLYLSVRGWNSSCWSVRSLRNSLYSSTNWIWNWSLTKSYLILSWNSDWHKSAISKIKRWRSKYWERNSAACCWNNRRISS